MRYTVHTGAQLLPRTKGYDMTPNGPTSLNNLPVDMSHRATHIARHAGPTPGPRERATLAYLIRHGIEYGTRRGPRVPRIPDVPSHRIEHPDPMARALHAFAYPDAYRADDSALVGESYRIQSRQTMAGTLPTYGADRPTIGERVRRFDLDDRTARDLEREANALLRADYEARCEGLPDDAERPEQLHRTLDIVDRWTLYPETIADAAAYRGEPRVKPRPIHASEQRMSDKTERHAFPTGIVTLNVTRITRADGTTVRYFGCTGVGYFGRKVIVKPTRGTGRPVGRPTVANLWTMPAATVRTRWARMLKGGSKREPIGADVIERCTTTERETVAALVHGARVVVHGATLDSCPDRSLNGRAQVIVRGVPDRAPTMVEDSVTAVRRAILASLK